MTALYNEIDKNAAAWLRQLISAGHIAPGVVDERDIRDLEPDYIASFTQFHAFAGVGVWSHALRLAGWADDRPIWTGSCPCQPFSAAGKGGGFDDERHLWPAFHHLIEQCRPDVVLGEQVASKDGLAWLDLVHADLEGTGYAVGAADTCAAGFGAPHIRQRLWWVGAQLEHASLQRREPRARDGSLRGSDTCSGAAAVELGANRSQDRLAQPYDAIGRAIAPGRDDDCGPDAGRPQGAGDVETGRGLCGLGNPSVEPCERNAGGLSGAQAEVGREDRQQHGHQPVGPEHASAGVDGLDAAASTSAQPLAAHPDRLADDDRDGAQQAQPGVHLGQPLPRGGAVRTGPTNGFWAAPDWLQCRDGKWRAVESGTFPLAHGSAARVGRLRGYGNAIVAQAAQGFIASVMEAVQ